MARASSSVRRADAEADQQQYTQQWEGQTWETQVQPPSPSPAADTGYAAETAVLPAAARTGRSRAPVRGSTAQAWSVGGAAVPAETADQAQRAPDGAAGPGSRGRPPGHARDTGPAPLRRPAAVSAAPGHRLPAASATAPPPSPATPGSPTPSGPAPRAVRRSSSPGMQPAALTAVLGLLLAGAAAVGQYALVVPLGAPPGRDRGGLVPAERDVARPAGHRAGLRRGAGRGRRAARGRPGERARRDPRHARRLGPADPGPPAAQPRRRRTSGCTG